jgi:hypothetical protein
VHQIDVYHEHAECTEGKHLIRSVVSVIDLETGTLLAIHPLDRSQFPGEKTGQAAAAPACGATIYRSGLGRTPVSTYNPHDEFLEEAE